MCGIAGVIGSTDRIFAENAIRKMVGALSRRGPDSEGIETWAEAVLGHRRLAIFDLSEGGSQPMVSHDRSVGIVFNGAIKGSFPVSGEYGAYQYLSWACKFSIDANMLEKAVREKAKKTPTLTLETLGSAG
jgi:asparagine synthase (glutamine-hydrolysing)